MKKRLLVTVLSFTLALQPAALCQAEGFFSDEQVMESEEIENPENGLQESTEISENSGTIQENEAEFSDEQVMEREEPENSENIPQENTEIPENPETTQENEGDLTDTDLSNGFQLNQESDGLAGFQVEDELEGFVGADSADELIEFYSETKNYTVSDSISAVLENGVLTVSGSGAMSDYSSEEDAPWYEDRNQIIKIVIAQGITRIGDNNFVYCSCLEELSLPEGFKTIGEAAFYGDSSIESVDFPNSMTEIAAGAFADCYYLSMINLGNGIQKLGDYAFQNTGLKTVHIPASVTQMSTLTFFRCYSLESYDVDKANANYESSGGVLYVKGMSTLYSYPLNKKESSYVIPNGVTEIADCAFLNCSTLHQITIPGTVIKIGDWAFNNTSLESIVIPDSVTSIGYGIVQDCTNLVSAAIGNGATEIPYRMFENCRNLTQITIGPKVKSIGNRAFWYCTSLTTLTLPEGLEEIGASAFDGCSGLETLTIPSSVQKIESDAFYGCPNLDLNLPSHLTPLDDGSYRVVSVLYYSGNFHYDDAYQVLEIVNQERAKAGLSALAMDESLLESAMQRAAECCLDFSHTRPSGLSCFSINSKASGENIAAGSSTASEVMSDWMSSAGHKANILGSYKSIGIGCFEQGGSKFWVQMFGTDTPESFEKPVDRSVRVKIDILPENYKDSAKLYWADGGTATMQNGKTRSLKVQIINPGWGWVYSIPDMDSFTWSSSNPSVATVDKRGNVTGVAAGNAKITAASSGFTMTVSVAVKGSESTATPTPTPKPSVTLVPNVTGVKIGGSASDALRLNWNKNTSAGGYIIEQKKNGSWVRIKKIEGNGTTTYRVDKLSAATRYEFRIRAYIWDSAAKTSKYSEYIYVSGTTLMPAVTGLKIGGSAADALRLNWNKNTSAGGYIIEQKKNGSWVRIKKIEGNGTTSYRVDKLSVAIRYEFRIRAYVWDSAAKTSKYSEYTYVSGMTLMPAVTGLKIGGSASDALRLNWNKNTSAGGYIVEQKKNGSWVRIKKIEGNGTTTYRVDKLSSATRYEFRMRAYIWDGVAKTSKYSEYTYVSGMTLVQAVTGLKIGGSTSDALRLNWNKNTSAGGYIIEQKKNGSWVRIKKIEGNGTTTYRVDKLTGATRYEFRMKAYIWDSVAKTSKYSGYTYVSGMTLMPAVTGLKIGGSASDALRLNWNKNASAGGYIIEQKKNGSWVRIKKIEGNGTTTYRVDKLSGATRYEFRMRAYVWDSVAKTSKYSEYTYVSGMTLVPAITGLKIGGSASDALRLNWNKNTSVGGYIIEQKKNGSWVRIKKIEGNGTTSYRVEKLNKATKYEFRMRAYNWDSTSKTSKYSGYTYVSGTTLRS